MLAAEDLVSLGDFLRGARFKVATHQHIAAQRLLVQLARSARLPENRRGLAPYLAPLYCCTAEQQARFPALYREWLALHFREEMAIGQAGTEERTRLPPEAGSKPRPFPVRRALAAIAALLVVVAVAGWFLDQSWPRTETGRVTAGGQPLSGATIRYGNSKRTSADPSGEFALDYRKLDLPLEIEASREGYSPSRLSLTADTTRPVTIDLTGAPTAKAEEKKPQPPPPAGATRIAILDPLSPSIVEPAPSPEPRFEPWRAALAFLPMALALLWWAVAMLQRRGALERIPGTTPNTLKEVSAGTSRRLALMEAPLRRLAHEMRRRIRVETARLDVEATLQETVRRAGLVQPVFGSRVEPAYLVLIDRAGLWDHQARLAGALVALLHRPYGVQIEAFEYDADPRRCRPIRLEGGPAPQDEWISLSGIAARFPDHRLILFSDGRGFLDGFTGGQAEWVADLLAWPQPVVMTPEAPERWGRREWRIERMGFVLLPVSSLGFAALGGLLGRDRPPSAIPPESAVRPVPEFLRDPRRWLDRSPPPPAAVDQLRIALRRDLGDEGFAWLCACAVYPELHWGITLRVGHAVIDDPQRLSLLLPRLARLPWLREGFMPDWLREALLDRLAPEAEAKVRTALEGMLRHVAEQPGAEMPLRVAAERPAALAALGKGLRALFRPRSKLDAPPSARVDRDLVFLRFLEGRPRRLGVAATNALRRIFYREGLEVLGARLLPALALALAPAWAVLYWLPPQVPVAPGPPVVRANDVTAVALSRDGAATYVGYVNGEVLVFDGETPRRAVAPTGRPVTALAVAADDRVAVSLADASIRMGNLADRDPNRVDQQLPPALAADAYVDAPPGQLRLQAGNGRTVDPADTLCMVTDSDSSRAYSVGKGFLAGVLAGEQGRGPLPVRCAASQGATQLAVLAQDRSVYVLPLRAAPARSVGAPRTSAVAGLRRVPLTTEPSAAARQTGIVPVATLPDGAPVESIAVSADGRTIAVQRGDGSVLLRRPSPMSFETLLPEQARAPVALSGDGLTLAVADARRQVQVWRLEPGGGNFLLAIGVDQLNPPRMKLQNPLPDIRRVADVLERRYGFAATRLENPRRAEVLAALDRLQRQLTARDRVVIYYSGEGVEGAKKDPERFLLVMAPEGKSGSMDARSLQARELADAVAAMPAGEILTIIDASRSGTLAQMRGRPKGTGTRTLLYSAKADQFSQDTAAFSTALANALAAAPGPLTGRALAQQVASRMGAENTKSQTPGYADWAAAGSSGGDVLLTPIGSTLPERPVPKAKKPQPEAAPPQQAQPGQEQQQPQAQPEPAPPPQQQHSSTGSVGTQPPKDWTPILETLSGETWVRSSSPADRLGAGAVFRDCIACPEMVVVPPGTFVMGSPDNERGRFPEEGPRHTVDISRPFAVGRYEVTFDDWGACVAAGGCSHKPGDAGWGRGMQPVINVSWEDAQEYVRWLSRKTGNAYRLLSEAEWEYAARAGSTTPYPWGDKPGSKRANVNGSGSQWSGKQTAPVGRFESNAFGLRDMIGNVREWTQDCWNDGYKGAPEDGQAWESGDCGRRVVRGGGWDYNPLHARSADRHGVGPGNRSNNQGLRLARTL